MKSPLTRLTNVETGKTHRKDGSAEFYWVRPPINLGLYVGGHKTADTDMIEWCEQTFGSQLSECNSDGKWFYKGHRYYFLEEDDMSMFVLMVS